MICLRYGILAMFFNTIAGPILLSPSSSDAAEKRVLLFGDSLIAGYGLPVKDGLTANLDRALNSIGVQATLINAGVSGDTTAGGRARLSWALVDQPTHAIVLLGANDALRGLDPAQTKANLLAILETLREEGIPTLLVGMRSPRNWGEEYANSFDKIFTDLARQTNSLFYPFYLDGVALNPDYNQPDGIHPNAAGVELITSRMLPTVKKLLELETSR